MCRVAIHQINFVPWFPFFYKMAMVDVFVLLENVQFEKNGYQNRFKYKDKWITKPVKSGVALLSQKDYVGLDLDPRMFHNRGTVSELNHRWIYTIKETLDIRTRLSGDYLHTVNKGTDRIIELVKENRGTTYVTNPTAKDKYLDEDKIRDAGIEIEYCKVPRHLQKSTFEILEEYGIQGAIKQLPKIKK